MITSCVTLALASLVSVLVSVYGYDTGRYKLAVYAEALAALLSFTCGIFVTLLIVVIA